MSLALMRRDRDTPNGLMEFLVVRSIELLRERGVDEISLNFAAFARPLRSPRGLLDRTACALLRSRAGGSRSRACTASTRSSSRAGSRATSSSPGPPRCRRSGWRRWSSKGSCHARSPPCFAQVRRPRPWGALAVVLLIGAALTARARPQVPHAWPAGVDLQLPSKALRDEIGLRVYLPPDYDESTKRYPVIYFLHGLPASADAYRSTDFLRRACRCRAATPSSSPSRERETASPTRSTSTRGRGTTGRRPSPRRSHGSSTRGSGRSRASRPRDRRLSAGGYGAMLIGLHHLPVFSVIESWSGYFHPTDVTGTTGSTSARPRRTHMRAPIRLSPRSGGGSRAGDLPRVLRRRGRQALSRQRTSRADRELTRRACHTCSSSSPERTRRRSGRGTQPPGSVSRSITSRRRRSSVGGRTEERRVIRSAWRSAHARIARRSDGCGGAGSRTLRP